MSIDVLIADDQALVRAGFRMILEADESLRVVAEANDGAHAVEAARRTSPDIVLMDIRMPVMDGLEATRKIVATDDPPRVLILTTYDLDEYVFDALSPVQRIPAQMSPPRTCSQEYTSSPAAIRCSRHRSPGG